MAVRNYNDMQTQNVNERYSKQKIKNVDKIKANKINIKHRSTYCTLTNKTETMTNKETSRPENTKQNA